MLCIRVLTLLSLFAGAGAARADNDFLNPDVVAVDQEFEKLPPEGIIAFQLHPSGPMQVIFKEIKSTELK